jgi:hypothetical protein
VKFADVNLQGGGPRGSGSPGKGGWPTIRYYNKETGTAGADYEKRTDMAMCSELGPEGGSMLQEYIESAGKTSACALAPPHKGCSDKEKKFIAKMITVTPETWAAQKTRLIGMKEKKMKADLLNWVNARLAILDKLINADDLEALGIKSEL